MTKVPNLNYGQVIHALRRDGWVIVGQKGCHLRLQKHAKERILRLTVSAHNPVKRSTLSHIIKKHMYPWRKSFLAPCGRGSR